MAASNKSKEIQEIPTDMRDIESWDSALEFLRNKGVDVYSAEQTAELLGDGFLFVQNKGTLVNIPFVVVDCKFGMSDRYNTPYAMVWAVTATNKRVKFVDMSTGIADQLNNAKRALGHDPVGLVIGQGLQESNYTVEVEGETVAATTYYLNVG